MCSHSVMSLSLHYFPSYSVKQTHTWRNSSAWQECSHTHCKWDNDWYFVWSSHSVGSDAESHSLCTHMRTVKGQFSSAFCASMSFPTTWPLTVLLKQISDMFFFSLSLELLASLPLLDCWFSLHVALCSLHQDCITFSAVWIGMAALHSEALCQFTLTVYPQTIIPENHLNQQKMQEKFWEQIPLSSFFFQVGDASRKQRCGNRAGGELRAQLISSLSNQQQK